MARIAARLSLPNSSRVMHSHSRTSGNTRMLDPDSNAPSRSRPSFPQEHAIQLAGDGLGHGRERAHGMAIDDGFGGGFQNFQTVEGLQNVAAGDQHAVVFE